MVTLQKFTNLINLFGYFSNEQVCRDYLEEIRWNGNLQCPYEDCGHDHINKYSDGKRYKCSKCKRQYSVKVGTIFHDSKISLQKWFAAIYLITSHKKGISSLQLHRDVGVTQKTAWYILHRVRKSLGINEDSQKLTGEKHLQFYVDEFVFRYNTRNYSEDYRFDLMLNQINNAMSYKQLINNERPNNKMEAKQGSFGF